MIAGLPPDIHLVALTAVDSTNAEMRRRIESGAPHLTLIWAEQQQAGRGRRGRGWSSPPGNLYCTLLLRPEPPVALWGQLSFVAAVALRDAVLRVAPELETRLKLKWPNDLLIDGRKLSGILLEASGSEWVMIGTGVNLTSHPDGIETPAIALSDVGYPVAPAQLLPIYAEALLAWFERWRHEGFAPVRARWLEGAVGLGHDITVRLADRSFVGRFVALDDSGALLLEQPDGTRRVEAGEVFLPAA